MEVQLALLPADGRPAVLVGRPDPVAQRAAPVAECLPAALPPRLSSFAVFTLSDAASTSREEAIPASLAVLSRSIQEAYRVASHATRRGEAVRGAAVEVTRRRKTA